MTQTEKINWHSAPIEQVYAGVESSQHGLSSVEVAERLKKSGRNVLPSGKPYSKLKLFINQFRSPLIYILIIATGVSFYLRHFSDAVFIIVILFINTTVGFYQENKANVSLSALKKMVKIKAWVLRDGREKEIDSEEIVTGDVIFLKPGDKIPADARLLEAKNLKVNQSALTGEWLPVEKNTKTVPEETPAADRTSLMFMGTIVEEGRGIALVVETGLKTKFGETVKLLASTHERATPLQKKIASLSRVMSGGILGVICVILAVGYFIQKSFADIFVAALALSVSAIPAGLLPAITIILVFGMRRILKHNGLVRKLIANETLGSVTVICTDKTGTLTEGRMQVSHILTSTEELLREEGGSHFSKIDDEKDKSHILALKIAALVNDSFVENPEAEMENWVLRGSPTEKSLLLAALQAGFSKEKLEKEIPPVDKMSFNAFVKFSAVLSRQDDKKNLFIMGAPEGIISRSEKIDVDGHTEKITGQEAQKLLLRLQELTGKGLRVVACAYRKMENLPAYESLADISHGMTLVGFIAIKDPLRSGMREVISTTKKAGIRTVIITGDHRLTACAVAEEIGLDGNLEVLEGNDLERIGDEMLKRKVKEVSIFARVLPHHKLRIVRALQENKEVVAMIGDGINDAPALKAADIGVSVGSGTDVAKEVSDLVLLDDSFSTVVKAIEQGRVIFQNIRKVFVYLVADDFSELFIFLASLAVGLPIPLLPAQILWINLVEDGFPDIALTTEQEVGGVMQDKPRRSDEPILNKSLQRWMISIFLITGLSAFILFYVFLHFTGDLHKARTLVFVLVGFDSILFSFCVRSFHRPVWRRDIFSNRYLVGAAVLGVVLLFAAVYARPLQTLLATQPMLAWEWGIIVAVSLWEIWLIEVFKKRIFFKERNK